MKIIHKVFSSSDYVLIYTGLEGAKRQRRLMQSFGFTRVYIKRIKART